MHNLGRVSLVLSLLFAFSDIFIALDSKYITSHVAHSPLQRAITSHDVNMHIMKNCYEYSMNVKFDMHFCCSKHLVTISY